MHTPSPEAQRRQNWDLKSHLFLSLRTFPPRAPHPGCCFVLAGGGGRVPFSHQAYPVPAPFLAHFSSPSLYTQLELPLHTHLMPADTISLLSCPPAPLHLLALVQPCPLPPGSLPGPPPRLPASEKWSFQQRRQFWGLGCTCPLAWVSLLLPGKPTS